MSLDVASASAILKRTYPDGVVDVDYSNSKTLAILKKSQGTLVKSPFGASFDVPVKHGNPQAGSAVYATAYNQTTTENTRTKSWAVTPGTFWHFADVNGDVVRRGEGAGSFVDALTWEIENAKDAMRRIFEIMLFKGGFGDLAKFSSTAVMTSATGVALANPWMVRMVEIGMATVAAATEDTTVLRSATANKVTGRHASAGTLDFATVPSTLTWAAGDVLFRDGDRENSATPARRLPVGFKAWLPSAAPSATLFFGVDRTLDDRLGGLRVNANNSGSPEEAFMDGEAAVDAEGGKLTHVVMGRDTFLKVQKSMSNRVDYAEITTDMGIGIPGFRLKGSDAVMYWDSACEEGTAYGFNIEEVGIRYAGADLFTLEQTDGLMFRNVPGFDLWRANIVTTSQLIVPAPGHAVNIFNL